MSHNIFRYLNANCLFEFLHFLMITLIKFLLKQRYLFASYLKSSLLLKIQHRSRWNQRFWKKFNLFIPNPRLFLEFLLFWLHKLIATFESSLKCGQFYFPYLWVERWFLEFTCTFIYKLNSLLNIRSLETREWKIIQYLTKEFMSQYLWCWWSQFWINSQHCRYKILRTLWHFHCLIKLIVHQQISF